MSESFHGRPALCIVGAGPAGLRAAQVAAERGIGVAVFDAMPSAGRKFLVAGRGGLNLTNTAPHFEDNYSGPEMPPDLWKNLLSDFGPEALRNWAEDLGVETFAASSGRVYPRGMKSAPLLRRWIVLLKSLGVSFFHRHKWTGFAATPAGAWQLSFRTPEGIRTVETRAAILALGGGSWPQTGSDGGWQEVLQSSGVEVHPLMPANCGWEVPWPSAVIREVAGHPLKNIRGFAGDASAHGELMITDYGLEGGVVYALTPSLRTAPVLRLDLKPAFSSEDLLAKLSKSPRFHLHEAFERCRLQETARGILRNHPAASSWRTAEDFAGAVKSLPIQLAGPRPLAEAISSAGGVRWTGLDDRLMLRNHPGIFLAGEMLDWEAPTGGYLMQGCFSTGTRAGHSAADFLRE